MNARDMLVRLALRSSDYEILRVLDPIGPQLKLIARDSMSLDVACASAFTGVTGKQKVWIQGDGGSLIEYSPAN